MCSDNGILEEGVSNCPQNITAYQTINIINEVAGIGVSIQTYEFRFKGY